jgi:hypothetical protein
MNLDAILPIIDDIVKESLSEKVYIYGRYQRSTTSRVASGKLKGSIHSVIKPNKQGIQVIQMEAFGQPLINTYAYWLVNDRQPGPAPSSAIEKWIKEKSSFRIRDFKTGKYLPKDDKNIKSAAYVIARSLKKFGYQNKPKNFWEISVDKIEKNTQIIELLEQATFDDLYKMIEGI